MTEEDLAVIATIMRDSQQSLWSIYVRIDILTKEVQYLKYAVYALLLTNIISAVGQLIK